MTTTIFQQSRSSPRESDVWSAPFDFVGSYKLIKSRRFRVGVESFELSAGAIVSVSQHDAEHKKVLVEFGPSAIDWMPESILKDFERLD